MNNEELVKCWQSRASRSGSKNFWRILQHCEIGHFFNNLAHVPSGETDGIFIKILCIFGPESKPSGSGVLIRIQTPDKDSGDRDRIRLGGGPRSASALVIYSVALTQK